MSTLQKSQGFRKLDEMPHGKRLYCFPLVGKQKYIYFPLGFFFFSSPRHKGAVTAPAPRRLGAPSCSPTPWGCSQGWMGQAQGPRSSPNSAAWGSQEAPLGARHPAQCSALGPRDPVPDPAALVPSLQLSTGRRGLPESIPPIASSRNKEAISQAGQPCRGCCGC